MSLRLDGKRRIKKISKELGDALQQSPRTTQRGNRKTRKRGAGRIS